MIISFCTLAWFLYISWCTEENVLVFSFQNCIAKRSFLKLSKQNITSSGKLQYKNSFLLYQICRLEKNWNTSDRVYNLINCAYFSKKRLLNCKTIMSVELLGTFLDLKSYQGQINYIRKWYMVVISLLRNAAECHEGCRCVQPWN